MRGAISSIGAGPTTTVVVASGPASVAGVQHEPPRLRRCGPGRGRPSRAGLPGGDPPGLTGDGGDRDGERRRFPAAAPATLGRGVDREDRAVGGEHEHPVRRSARAARRPRDVARRSPSARDIAHGGHERGVGRREVGPARPRRRVSAPQVVPSATRAARSSSPSPCGPRSSRCRRLRSRSPSVAALRPAACCSAWRARRTC